MEQHPNGDFVSMCMGMCVPSPLDVNLHTQKHAYICKDSKSNFFAILFTLSCIGFYGFLVNVKFMQILLILYKLVCNTNSLAPHFSPLCSPIDISNVTK